MEKCYICSKESVVKISYTDSMGNKSTEYRCNICTEKLKSNENNIIHSTSECDNSNDNKEKTNFSRRYRGKIHNSYSKHPNLIKSNNIMI